VEWCDGGSLKGSTALCSKCGIDSVFGSGSGYPVDDLEFPEEMKYENHLFGFEDVFYFWIKNCKIFNFFKLF